MVDEESKPAQEEAPPTLLDAAREADEKARDEAPVAVAADGEAEPDRPAKPTPRGEDGKFIGLARKSRRERQRVERAAAELSQREQAIRLSEKDSAELAELRQLRALAADKPDEVVSRMGIDIGKLTDRLVQKGTPEEKLAELEARLDREATERTTRETEAEKVRREAAEFRAQEDFVKAAEADDYPSLAMLEPADVVSMGYRVGREIQQHFVSRGEHGRVPTDGEILAEMNARMEARAAKRAPVALTRQPTRTLGGGGARARSTVAESESFDGAMSSQDRSAAIARLMGKAGIR